VRHATTRGFWQLYEGLPDAVRRRADKCFALLQEDPRHPSLRLKKASGLWAVRIGLDYRALASEEDGRLVWFWIGDHDEYERLLS
jgi:hypothetical protein